MRNETDYGEEIGVEFDGDQLTITHVARMTEFGPAILHTG